MNTKDFNKLLNTTMLNVGSCRADLQALIVAGFEQYQEHGNTVYLTTVYNKCIGVRSLNTTLMGQFIMSIANVKLVTNKKTKIKTFKKDGDVVQVKSLIGVWYEFKKENTDDKPSFDVDKKTINYIKSVEKAIKDGVVTGSDLQKALDAVATLKTIFA